MIFDRLAKTVENLYPDLKIFLDRSRLFWINQNPHEFLRDEIPTEEIEPARWIGETTFRKNKKIYKVRVDL